jgi:hypothetical protein
LVYVAVAVHETAGVTVCSRAVPEVPHPDQFQEPEIGCGPNCTELPDEMVTPAVCCQAPPLTRRYGVMPVGVQPPPEEDELLELLLVWLALKSAISWRTFCSALAASASSGWPSSTPQGTPLHRMRGLENFATRGALYNQ